MAILLFGIFIVLVILNVPIAVCLGMAAVAAIASSQSVPLMVVAQKMFTVTDSFPLMAIPFFMVAGTIMEKGGISSRLIRFANSLVGALPGGLAIVTILASMFFAAISGSNPATVAAIGSIMIPAMMKSGYSVDFASATQASAGIVGVVIPPSITMITFGVVTGASIGSMFVAGVIPGLLLGLAMTLVAFFTAKKRGYVGQKRDNFKEVLKSFKDAIPGLLMPIIILGGIYGGIFTPTEAADVAVVYGLIVGFFVYKDLKLKDIPDILRNSAISTALVMLIIATAAIFGLLLTREMIPNTIANYFISLTENKFALLMLINVLLLIVGTFMETNAAIIILAPIFYPVIMQMGIDPVHFGLIMIVNLAIGTITPPLGVNLFVACGMTDLSIDRIAKANWVYLGVLILVLVLLTYLPGLSLWLPKLMMH